MLVQLSIHVVNPRLSPHEGLKLGAQLRNMSGETCELPSPYDMTDAFTLEVYSPGGALMRRMNGLAYQAMMTSGRVDTRPDLDTLEANAQWDWTLNMASYHHLLPVGDWEVEAVYEYPEAEVIARSGRTAIQVVECPILALSAVRDNPVIEGLTLLIRAEGDNAEHWYLRQYNYQRPLASWYSEPVQLGKGVEQAFCATSEFFQTESFEPFSRKWIVWQEGEAIRAQGFEMGVGVGKAQSAALPDRRTLFPFAYRTLDEKLGIFCLAAEGAVECYSFDASSLNRVFAHPLPAASEMLSIGVDADFIHLVMVSEEVLYQRLNRRGELLEQQRLFSTRRVPYACRYDSVSRTIYAVLRESDDTNLQLVTLKFTHRITIPEETNEANAPGTRNGVALAREKEQANGAETNADGRTAEPAEFAEIAVEVNEWIVHSLPIQGEITEMHFDTDRRGRFHLLFATRNGELYYCCQEHPLRCLAQGEPRYFPYVVTSDDDIFVGLANVGEGYRFVQMNSRQSALGTQPPGAEVSNGGFER